MDAQDCEAPAAPEAPIRGYVAAWWDMVERNLRHTVPSCRGEEASGKDRCWYEAALHDGNPIIIYLHGSAQHRAASHRLNLVKIGSSFPARPPSLTPAFSEPRLAQSWLAVYR
ncbi:Abhydrolase domain-containing protein 12B [Tupaia chinensis]|uniref:Abhydrolase domain-containing protein 12B n=1 Tax=Tupaia chinensis TaxID=246437 RepID=L9J9S0_TUPCH|nr:Abhydrolase domain-containing protein 12B [Tupaia chinensis]